MTAQSLKPGTIVGHRYRIEQFLGRGGIGSVYLSRDLAEEKARVAVKMLTAKNPVGPEVDSLREEFSVLSRLRHPNLVQILDFGVSDESGVPYLVEEYVEGEDLYRVTESWTLKEILRLLVVLCRVVQFLHIRGIVHGDLKASNALLPARETDPEKLKVLDFGLAIQPEGSRKISAAGTLAYTAPEILLGKSSGPRSDLYSMGILFYQLLARRLPFEDEDPGFLIQKHLQGVVDLRPIERLEGGAGLVQLVRALLEKDPAKRPSSAEDVIRLVSVAGGEDYSGASGAPLESYFSAARFVGRDQEIEHLHQCAGQVRESGRGKSIFIIGESGAGKSRCMEELKIWALLEGWRVVEGNCRAGEERSYGAYRQVLARTEGFSGTLQERSQQSSLFRFEEHARPAGFLSLDTSTETAAGQFRDHLTREIVRRLSGKPTILMLHDFHWADEATTAVLEYLTSDVQAHPILVCVSLRAAEGEQGPVGRLIENSIRQLRAESLALEPLSEEAVSALIASMTGEVELADSIAHWFWKASGGNPFFVEEILKHLVDRGLLWREEGKWKLGEEMLGLLEAPKSVAVVLRDRLERLSAKAREMANWLAVIDRSVRKDDLRAIVSLKPTEFEQGVEELIARQMIRREGKEGLELVEFQHALISEVIRADLSPRKRCSMHRIIGETLEQQYGAEGHVQELALHFTEGRAGDKAVRYALEAAAQCRAVFANETALHFLEYALKNKGGSTREELCQAAIDAADACCALGIPKRAIRLLNAELKLVRSVNTVVRARMLLQLTSAYQHSGDLGMLESTAKRGLRLTQLSNCSGDGVIRGLLLSSLAYCRLFQSRPKDGLLILENALRSPKDEIPVKLEGRIHSLNALLHRVSCNLRAACRSAEKAISALDPSEEIHLLSALSNHGFCLVALGRFPRAIQQHSRAAALSESIRSVVSRSQALGNLAECLCRAGLIKEAIEVSERAHKVVSDSNNPAISYAFSAILAEIKICSGDYRSGAQILDDLSRVCQRNLALLTVGQVHYLRALLSFELGSFDEVHEHLKKLEQINSAEAPIYEYELGQILKARIYCIQDHARKAILLLESLLKAATKKHWPYQISLIKLRLAEVFIKEARIEQAQKHVSKSLRLAEAMQCLPLMSLGHFLQGVINAKIATATEKSGSEDSAIEEYETALRLAETSINFEVSYRTNLELAKIKYALSDDQACLSHANRALQILSDQESRIPPESTRTFRNAFGHDQMRSQLTLLIESCNRRQGFLRSAEIGMNEEQLRVLFRVSHAINSIKDLDTLLNEIVDLLIQSLGMERALLFLRSKSTDKLCLATGRNIRGEALQHAEAISQSVLRDVSLHGRPFVSANARADPRVSSMESVVSYQLGTVLCAPLKANGRVIGIIYADHSSAVESLSESTISLFAAFCNLAAVAIDNALAHRQLLEEKTELQQHLRQVREGYPEIVGQSVAIQQLRERIAAVAASPLDVLITGESGTGKELVARAIHRTGRRSAAGFVPADCGSFSESLVESELFGYRKGAFTGSTENRAGLIETANGGVLFLDEIANLSLKLQAKLLRVLQEREVRRIGETAPRKIDIQVVAATNRDLRKEIDKGRFREDLYYRLNAMEIRLPALRDRLEDVPLLLDWFLANAVKEEGRSKRFSPEAFGFLSSYSYPGNVRELRNIVLSCYYTAKGSVIELADLPQQVRSSERAAVRRGESDEHSAEEIYQNILRGEGNFADLVRQPFLQRQFGKGVLRQVIRRALVDSRGRYRKALRLLRIPDETYRVTIQFLKRNDCYLDFRPFRKHARVVARGVAADC